MRTRDRRHSLFDPVAITVLALASGLPLTALAVARRLVNSDFDVFLASARSLAYGSGGYSGALASQNTNPPHVVALFLPLLSVSPQVAYWCWTVASTAALLVTLWALWRKGLAPTARAVAIGLAFTGTFHQIAGGQVAWALALPMALAWATRGIPCGLLVGLCASVKPFLLVFPAYFAARRQWRELAGCIVGFLAPFAVAAACLGTDAHEDWLASLRALNTAFHYSNGAVFGVLARLGQPTALGWLDRGTVVVVWLAAAAAIAGTTAWRLTAIQDRSREWALVVTAALLLSPLGQSYYLYLALGPLWQTLGRRPLTRHHLGVLGFFWWPNFVASPDPPQHLWQLPFYCLAFLAMLTLWLHLAFGGHAGEPADGPGGGPR